MRHFKPGRGKLPCGKILSGKNVLSVLKRMEKMKTMVVYYVFFVTILCANTGPLLNL